MPKKTPAAEQFAALGVPEDQWTDAMRLAVKQKWSGLPVTEKVADLRDMLALAEAAPIVVDPARVKTDMVLAGRVVVTDADVKAEVKRLKRNAAVNAWRERNQIRAALDARELHYAALRAKRKPAAKASAAVAPSALAS